MVHSSEGRNVAFDTTESGSDVILFNSYGAVPSEKRNSRRVHASNAGIVRVEKSACWAFYRLYLAYLLCVNRHSDGRVRKHILGGSTPSGGNCEGVVSTDCNEAGVERSEQQPPGGTEVLTRPSGRREANPRLEGPSRGTGGPTGGTDLLCGGGVPSAGWREIAESCHATGGQSHEH